MASDFPKPSFDGELPDPPRGPAEEIARTAWKMGWKAEKLADIAATHSLSMFEELGRVARLLSTQMARHADDAAIRFEKLETEFRDLRSQLSPKIEEASRNAREAQTSSHDLSDEVEKMEGILAEIKHKAVDSDRVKKMVVEEHQVLVARDRLEYLEKREAAALARQAEKRVYRLSTRSMIVSGLVVAVFGIVGTYFWTKATTKAASAIVQASPH